MLSHVAENSTGRGWQVSDSCHPAEHNIKHTICRAYISTARIFSLSTGEGLGGDNRNKNVKGGRGEKKKASVSKFFTADKSPITAWASFLYLLPGVLPWISGGYLKLLPKTKQNKNRKTYGKILQDANKIKYGNCTDKKNTHKFTSNIHRSWQTEAEKKPHQTWGNWLTYGCEVEKSAGLKAIQN